MLRISRSLVLLLLAFATGRLVYGETITFADLPPDPNVGEALPLMVYDGFVFPFFLEVTTATGSIVVEAGDYPFGRPCCYKYGIPYPYDIAASLFYKLDSVAFTLNSLEVTSDTTVQILGLRQGILIDEASIITDDLNKTPVFVTLNWSGIDAVVFPGILSQHYLEIDDITVDEAPVPEPSTIFLLGSGVLGFFAVARRKL